MGKAKVDGPVDWSNLKAQADSLRTSHGYGPAASDNQGSNEEKVEKVEDLTPVNFDGELSKLLTDFEFVNSNSSSALTNMNKAFKKHN